MDRMDEWFPLDPFALVADVRSAGAMMYAETATSGLLTSSFWRSTSSAMSEIVWRRVPCGGIGGAGGCCAACGRGDVAVLFIGACGDCCCCRCGDADDSVLVCAFRRCTFSSGSFRTGPLGVERLSDLLPLPEELKPDAVLVCVKSAGTGGLTCTFFGCVERVGELFTTGPSSDACRAYCLNTSSMRRSAFCCFSRSGDSSSSIGPLGIRRSCECGSLGSEGFGRDGEFCVRSSRLSERPSISLAIELRLNSVSPF